ncbi:MAG: TIGR03089 family protein [Sporichthyaceae bacterium]|nr:TIGR03089 family protein [Sporichthyaceae bacterium]
MLTPADLLDRAVASEPSRPLLTAYDDATDERIELSVLTFATWVAKTANLLRDELDVQSGSSLRLRLPLHWQAAVWLQAAWALGLVVDLDGRDGVDVAVVAHGSPDRDSTGADHVVSLGLGPMGLPRAGALPTHPAAVDYDRSVHAQGDRFVPTATPRPDDPVLRSRDGTVTGAALLAAALGSPTLPAGSRLLVTQPLRTVSAVLGALVVPLAMDTTAVLCRHLDEGRLAERIRQERLTAALPGSPGPLPVFEPAVPVMT